MLKPKQIAAAGQISPGRGSAKFEYFGKFYTQQGYACDTEGNQTEFPDADNEDEVLPGAGGADDAPPPVLEVPMDLDAWAAGTQKYEWFEVQAKLKEAYGKDFSSATQAQEFVLSQ